MNKWKFLLLIIAVLFIIVKLGGSDSKDPEVPENPNSQYFSGWDGSNPEFVTYIKGTMNDPDSFEHVETRYNENQDGTLGILMEFRGKNAFGGVVTNKHICTFDKYTRSITKVQ